MSNRGVAKIYRRHRTVREDELDGVLFLIDEEEKSIQALEPLRSFILPGGGAAAAHLHLARSIVRRAERAAVAAAREAPINPLALAYVNRLSDHLFVLARLAALPEGGDVLWKPGATRGL